MRSVSQIKDLGVEKKDQRDSTILSLSSNSNMSRASFI